jgi:hypothetical protein
MVIISQKITTLLCKFYLKLSQLKLDFWLSFTIAERGLHRPPYTPRRYVPALRSSHFPRLTSL